uniref:Uncharacterized protein n=1 Tax=Rhizophora mucronata TaxID=61149 RepID=A0A2P2P3S1_RHIMU
MIWILLDFKLIGELGYYYRTLTTVCKDY